jgi:hypothetical protein
MTTYLSLKTYVNVPIDGNRQNKLGGKNYFWLASWKSMTKRAGSGAGSVNQVYRAQDPDPDSYKNVTDPEHWSKWRVTEVKDLLGLMVK